MINQNRHPEPPDSKLIPWHAFANAQAAYDWAKAHVQGFNYNGPICATTELYVRSCTGLSFYTDFLDPDGRLEVIRLWVKP